MMSINHAILGMLSHQPMTGYDLKKIMQDSPFMYWSGNNNQIYKALLELNAEGFVTSETQHQDGSPSKKIYTITEDGLAELRLWTLTAPEAPEIKKAFLVQLAWTWQLSNAELTKLLDQYEQVVRGELLIERAKISPNRTPREEAVWTLIYENISDSFAQELNWIDRVRKTIAQFEDVDSGSARPSNNTEGEEEMSYQLVEKNGTQYVLLDTEGKLLQTEQDGLDIVSICASHGTNLVLIPGERLPDDFFRLRTGVAGAILQKLTMYNIKVAAVLDEKRAQGKFKEFLAESNRGKMFRAYPNSTEAEKWLTKTNERTYER